MTPESHSVAGRVSIAEAARLVQRSPKTLYRDYVNTGKLSVSLDARGRKQVDISELIRVFGALAPTETVADTVAMRQPETGFGVSDEVTALLSRLSRAEEENVSLRERLSDKERHIEDLRQALKLLEYRATPESQATHAIGETVVVNTEKKPGWFSRWLKKR